MPVPCRLNCVRSRDLHTQSERLKFSISKVLLSRPPDDLVAKYSTETLGLLPLASILLSDIYHTVWHSYHWHQYLILALSFYSASELLESTVF